MERRGIRVEPYTTYLEKRRKTAACPVVVAGGFVFVSGLPPFDVNGKAPKRPFEQQAEVVLAQMKRCLEAAGSSMERVLKCNVYCTDPKYFGVFNEAYGRYFPVDPPARIFLCVPCFPGPFDVEIDCIAAI